MSQGGASCAMGSGGDGVGSGNTLGKIVATVPPRGVTSAAGVAAEVPGAPIWERSVNSMDPQDRDVLVLRHFEELSNAEAAQVLGIKPSAAVNRYVRALKRLKAVFQG